MEYLQARGEAKDLRPARTFSNIYQKQVFKDTFSDVVLNLFQVLIMKKKLKKKIELILHLNIMP